MPSRNCFCLFPEDFLNSMHDIVKRGFCRGGNTVDLRLFFLSLIRRSFIIIASLLCLHQQVHSIENITHTMNILWDLSYMKGVHNTFKCSLERKTFEWLYWIHAGFFWRFIFSVNANFWINKKISNGIVGKIIHLKNNCSITNL